VTEIQQQIQKSGCIQKENIAKSIEEFSDHLFDGRCIQPVLRHGGSLLTVRVASLVRDQVAFERELQSTFADNRLPAELLMVAHVDLDVEPFPALPARVALLSSRVLSAVVSPQLVQADKCFVAGRAAGGDLLVVPCFERKAGLR
jgi:hypothetical protein